MPTNRIPLLKAAVAGRSRPRRRRSTLVVALVLGITAAVAMAGCGDDEPESDSSGKPVLNVGISSPPNDLDAANDSGYFQFVGSLFRGTLVYETPDNNYEPWLATEWEYVGDDHTVFELTLREGLKFSDGTTLDAAAVKTSMDYFRDLGKSGFIGNMGKGITIEAIDDLKVRLTFDEPNLAMPAEISQHDTLWGAIQSPACIEAKVLSQQTCGAGPYMLDTDDTVIGQTYILVPNTHYFDQDAIKWSKVVLKVIPQPATMLQALQAGEVDVAFGDPTTQEGASEVNNVTVEHAFGQAAGINLQNRVSEPLSDVRVRQALNYAIDRETITREVLGSDSVASSSIMSSDALTDEAQNYYSYDPDKAKALLAEAGYADGLSLRVLAPSYMTIGQPLEQAIASYWQKVGVEVELIPFPDKPAGTALVTGKEFDANELIVPVGPFQINYFVGMRPGGGPKNIFDASDEELDALWAQAATLEDPKPVLEQMNLLAVEKAFFVPTSFLAQYYYVRSDKVENVNVTNERQAVPFANEWTPVEG